MTDLSTLKNNILCDERETFLGRLRQYWHFFVRIFNFNGYVMQMTLPFDQNKAINENFVDLSLLRWEVGALLQKLHFFANVLIFLRILDHNDADQMTCTVVKIIFQVFKKKIGKKLMTLWGSKVRNAIFWLPAH